MKKNILKMRIRIGKKRGISPIIGAVFIFAILLSTMALYMIWQVNMEELELQREKERTQQLAEKGGESLVFLDYSTGTRYFEILNNGAFASTITFLKSDDEVNEVTQLSSDSIPPDDTNNVIQPNSSKYIYVGDTNDWETITAVTELGNSFVYNKPTAIILKYEPTGADFTFYGDAATIGSTIVSYEWDWEYGGDPGTFGDNPIKLSYGQNAIATENQIKEGQNNIALRVTDTSGHQAITSMSINITGVVAQVTPIVPLENIGNTGGTFGRWWIFRFRKGCDQVSIPLQNISASTISLTDIKIFWHELQQSDPCVSDLCPARLASIRIYRQYKPDGVWNGEWVLTKSSEPTTWNPNFDPDPSTPEQENFPSGIAILGKYRFMDPEDLWRECFWGFYETQDCNCLDCEGTSPDYIGFNISGELMSFVEGDDPNTPEYFQFEPNEIIVVTLRFCAGNRCGDDLTLKLYDPEEVYTITVHVPLDLQVGPRDGSIEDSTNITFRWRELFDYESWFLFGGCVHDDDYHYWLQISTDPDFPSDNRIDVLGGSIFNYSEVAIVKYTTNLTSNQRYYWRVNGSRDQGNTWSGWSRPWTFCTISCPTGDTVFLNNLSGPPMMDHTTPLFFIIPLGLFIMTLRRKI
jgi:hypothetical protein